MGAKPTSFYNRILAINDRIIMRLQCMWRGLIFGKTSNPSWAWKKWFAAIVPFGEKNISHGHQKIMKTWFLLFVHESHHVAIITTFGLGFNRQLNVEFSTGGPRTTSQINGGALIPKSLRTTAIEYVSDARSSRFSLIRNAFALSTPDFLLNLIYNIYSIKH